MPSATQHIHAEINGLAVYIRDQDGNIMLASGTTVPTDGDAGYGSSCIFMDDDSTDSGTGLYKNIGTATSCDFNAVTITADA